MEIVRHPDAAAFACAARPLYDTDPLRHTVALTVLDALVRTGERPALALTVHEGGEVAGAVLRTEGRPLQVSGLPQRLAPAVADALSGEDVIGAAGPVELAQAFASAWAGRHPVDVRTGTRLRLFSLDALVPPSGVPGAARQAGADDIDRLAAWRTAFEVEENDTRGGPGSPREAVERNLAAGGAEWIWEDGGVPVSQASVRGVVAGMTRIGPVYTEPARRGHGYAAAVTAAATQWALDAGARRVLLFTDATNALTNRLYPRLGYRFELDALELTFHTTQNSLPSGSAIST
jgi:GNAT superfamily N-acetyltransferase